MAKFLQMRIVKYALPERCRFCFYRQMMNDSRSLKIVAANSLVVPAGADDAAIAQAGRAPQGQHAHPTTSK